MGDTRKIWTKNRALTYLEPIASALKELENLADGGGQMPSSFRRRIITANTKTRSLIEDLRRWAITPGEKAIAKVKQERAPYDPKERARAKEVVTQRLPSRNPALRKSRKGRPKPKKAKHSRNNLVRRTK